MRRELKAREREVRASRANQSVEVELLAIGASPDGLRALAVAAIGAPHVHLPAEASRRAQCFHFHENKDGTRKGFRQALP